MQPVDPIFRPYNRQVPNRKVKIADDAGIVQLPNGLPFTAGQEAVLTGDEFDTLDPSRVGTVVTDEGYILSSQSPIQRLIREGGVDLVTVRTPVFSLVDDVFVGTGTESWDPENLAVELPLPADLEGVVLGSQIVIAEAADGISTFTPGVNEVLDDPATEDVDESAPAVPEVRPSGASTFWWITSPETPDIFFSEDGGGDTAFFTTPFGAGALALSWAGSNDFDDVPNPPDLTQPGAVAPMSSWFIPPFGQGEKSLFVVLATENNSSFSPFTAGAIQVELVVAVSDNAGFHSFPIR